MFTEAGCRDVSTYIQSGNVVFRAGAPLAKRIPSVIRTAIASKYGFDVPIIIRSAEDLRTLTRNNPFLRAGCDPVALHVAFLADAPAKAAVAALDPQRSPGDEFVVRGRDIYLHLPKGTARSKLTNQYFDSTLGTISSGRNWRTVLTLFEMTRG